MVAIATKSGVFVKNRNFDPFWLQGKEHHVYCTLLQNFANTLFDKLARLRSVVILY